MGTRKGILTYLISAADLPHYKNCVLSGFGENVAFPAVSNGFRKKSLGLFLLLNPILIYLPIAFQTEIIARHS
jgi:hypothetical protein